MAKTRDAGPTPSCRAGVVQPESSPCEVRQSSLREDHQRESRMREICQSGSEGGEPQTNAASLPLSNPAGPTDFVNPPYTGAGCAAVAGAPEIPWQAAQRAPMRACARLA